MSSMIKQEHSEAAFAAAVQLLKVKTLSGLKSNDNDVRKLPKAPTVDTTPKKRGRGRPKGRKTTTHPQLARPKRPLSAYNLFFRDERNKIVENSKDDNEQQQTFDEVVVASEGGGAAITTGKLKFADLARTVGPRWKLIDEETKKHYEARAAVEMSKYKAAMAVYNRKLEAITKLEQSKVKANQEGATADGDDAMKKRKRDEDEKKLIKPPRKLHSKKAGGSNDVATTATTPSHHIKVHQDEITPGYNIAHNQADQQAERSLRLPLRKRRFEAAADEYSNNTPSFSTHQEEEVARTSRLQRAIEVDEVMSLNVPSSLQDRRGNLSHLLDQQLELRRKTMNATAAATAASLRNHHSSTAADASSAALHSALSSRYQAAGLSNLTSSSSSSSSSFAQPPPMQSDMADIILKRAIELEAAKRLVEERQQQLNHDMAVEAALARRQRLVEEQQSQTVNLMLRLQQEREQLQNRFYRSQQHQFE